MAKVALIPWFDPETSSVADSRTLRGMLVLRLPAQKGCKHEGETLLETEQGSGLGLYSSKQFVEAMQGRVWVESAGIAGQGSRFYVTLPGHPQSMELTIAKPSNREMRTNTAWSMTVTMTLPSTTESS